MTTLQRNPEETIEETQAPRVGRVASGMLGCALSRVLRPPGVMVVFLGPDGAGKSSVVREVRAALVPAVFPDSQYYHLRPYLRSGNRGDGGVRNPHGPRPRGLISSLAKLGLWWVDYTFGYLTHVRPGLVRGRLVCFDRYYHDLIVDQRRYRYGGPLSLMRFVGRCVPHPDLFILLDAPAEVVQQRKQDITLEETRRQRQAYLELIARLPNGRVVDASQPLERVVADAKRAIMESYSRRSGAIEGSGRP